MTSREIIRRVLEFGNPPRIGFAFSGYGGQERLNDFVGCGPADECSTEADSEWRLHKRR